MHFNQKHKLGEKCPYFEFFWSVFSLIRTDYGDLQIKSPYSVQMREKIDQRNSQYGQFSWSQSRTHANI